MPALITNKYRTFLAQSFIQGVTANTYSAYVFVGRPQEWVDSANVAVNDSNPPAPVDCVQTVDYDYWRDIIGLKRIAGADTLLVVRRIDWTASTVYDQYDDLDANLATKNFYVIDTSAGLPYQVYKCLWNNHGQPSTVAPSTIGAVLTAQVTADSYVWQYMYSVGGSDTDFLTTHWMPLLANAAVQASALTNAGALPLAVPLIINSGGANYQAANPITVTIEGDGNNAVISSGGVSIVGGAVVNMQLANSGLGYTEITSINVFQGGATLANVRCIIPPFPNHGYDPAKELRARAVMMNTQFADDESGKLTVENDYRRVGLLINPVDANGNIATAGFYRMTTDITISSNTGGFAPDDVIINNSKAAPQPSALVVDVVVVANNYVIRLTDIDDQGHAVPFAADDIIKVNENGSEGTVSDVTNPELALYSGQILFVNQRTPVTRSISQTEEIKLVFPFN